MNTLYRDQQKCLLKQFIAYRSTCKTVFIARKTVCIALTHRTNNNEESHVLKRNGLWTCCCLASVKCLMRVPIPKTSPSASFLWRQ